MEQNLTKEEKQLLQLCRDKDADICQFMSLLKQGVRINIYDEDGKHPLSWVSYHGRRELVELFLKQGAAVDLPTANKFGSTALITASDNGHLETAKLLLQSGALVNYQRKDGFTSLYFASKNNHIKLVQLLLKSEAQVNKGTSTPLYTASLNGRLNIAQILLDHGADVNQPCDTKIRSSPLGIACMKNHLQLSRLLINNGADSSYSDNYGNTPLHWASKSGYPELVQILVQSHANLNVTNKLGNTPLHRAVENGHNEVVKQLLLPHASLDIKNNDGLTPLQLAEKKKYSDIVALLKTGVPAPGSTINTEISSTDKDNSEGDESFGHILTKEEIEVLGSLLAPYTDKRLKELRLSIQKKQEGGISREKVEILLRQSGLTMIADRLKDDIENGLENVKHYKAYEQALQDGISLTLRYLKFLFVGPPRSGKTSARRRLVQEIINLSSLGQPSKSTGAAEASDVVIKKLVCESTAIINSTWQSIHKSQGDSSNKAKQQEGELTQLARWFYWLISAASDGAKIMAIQNDGHQSSPTILSNESNESGDTDCSSDYIPEFLSDSHSNDPEDLEIKAALEELTTILQSDSPLKLEQIVEELVMISMVDVGGQPAFLEMLPSLTIGPALYFLFFRLDQEFGKSYKVRYHPSDNETETTLETYYCMENVLYQSLSSIACCGCYSHKDDVSSGVLLFGTYKDKVTADRISQITRTLEEKLLKSKFYQDGLLLKTSKGNLFYSLDNMNGDESEMSEIRSDVEEIVKNHFSATPIPAAWLMFRIVLHLLRKPVLSLAQCKTIARKLSMPTSVEEALWFFHHNIGNLMYYSDIPSMQDTVICDPQIIFDSVSELIIDRFRYSNRNLSSREVDDFHQKGQFSLAQIDDKTESQRSGHLKLTQMVDLLKNLNIITEIKEDEDELEVSAADPSQPPATDQSQPKFIMPAVLKYASEEELKTPPITNSNNQSVPMMIHFESGFVPFGIFCATTAHIIARQDSLSPRWRMCDDQVMRNKATFCVDGAFFATIISRDQYLEINVSRHPNARKRKSLSLICSTVRQTVVNSLQNVISKMKFKPYVKMDTLFSSRQLFDLGFTCCLDDSHNNHLMRVVEDWPSERYAKCLMEGNMEINLKDQHMVWFDEELEKQSLSEGQSVKTPVTTSLLRENNSSIVLEKPAQAVAATLQAADMNCPVCLNIQVDPCTISCGHSICQLCLARLWKSNEKFCPLCKQMWREFPAISYDYRASIEGSHRQEVDQIRKQYTEKDKQCVERFVEARNSSLKSEQTALKTSSTDSEVFNEDICEPKNRPQPLLTDQPPMDVQPQQQAFSKDMSYEQLAMWLTNHPQFMGKGYQQDISKLKDARINGFALLNLNESRLDRLGMSMGFHVTLMSIIEDLKSSQQPQDSKRLTSQQQLSPAGSATHQTTQHQQTTFQAAINLDDIPKLDELLIFKYMDKGEKKKIRIISEASHKWTDIAILICGDTNVTSVLEQKYHGDPNKCLKQTFISYFISKKPQRYTQDWNGLIELLDDVDLETLAENIKHALPNACT